MRIDLKRYIHALIAAVVVDAALFAVVFAPRPALTEESWTFLERQRPMNSSDGFFSVCHDCLDFALFRRGFGGWENVSARILQITNLPGFVGAARYFRSQQRQRTGTSKEHSDAATLILVATSVSQCALLAALVSIRRKIRPGTESRAAPDDPEMGDDELTVAANELFLAYDERESEE